MNENFEGSIQHIFHHQKETGWIAFQLKLKNNDLISVVATHPSLSLGESVTVRGQWVEHPRFGKQLKASLVERYVPQTNDQMLKFLAAGHVKGIGPKLALALDEKFGEDLSHVFNHQIEKLLEVRGIGRSKFKQIADSWAMYAHEQKIFIKLNSYNISVNLISKLIKTYGHRLESVLNENPYQLSDEVRGIGFLKADSIARNLGFALDDPRRINAAILYLMHKIRDLGHCFSTEELLREKLHEIIELPQEILEKSLADLIKELKIIKLSQGGLQLPEVFQAENSLANRVKSRIQTAIEKLVENDSWESVKNKFEIKLSYEQEQAVKGVLKSSLSILTGGPGSGKTTTLKFLVEYLLNLNKQVVLAAPTGRAAQRLFEVTNLSAQTIHRLLMIDQNTGQFFHNENRPLVGDFFIIDESSMLDLFLADALFKAIPLDAQILLVGDRDQLPSIGPGNILRDLIAVGTIPVFSLQKIFRQTAGDSILDFAKAIRQGEHFYPPTPLEYPSLWAENKSVLMLDTDEADYSIKRFNKTPRDFLYYLISDTIPKYWGKDLEVQVLSPMHRGELGVKELNIFLQQNLNPFSSKKEELLIGDRIFRLGDRVLQKKNNYELDVFNGDLGTITSIDLENRSLVVDFTLGMESKTVLFEGENLFQLELSYAMTIHKSQGSEFDVVIVPLVMSHYVLLQRALIYTAITRAKKLVIIMGERRALQFAITNQESTSRLTQLKNLIAG